MQKLSKSSTFKDAFDLDHGIVHYVMCNQGVGHSHVHNKSNCIFAKIFHVSPQVTVQKIDRTGLTGISRYLGSTLCLLYNEVVFVRKNRSVVEK